MWACVVTIVAIIRSSPTHGHLNTEKKTGSRKTDVLEKINRGRAKELK
jgi:hypothetical protein